MKRKCDRDDVDEKSSEGLFASTYLRSEVFHYRSVDSLLKWVTAPRPRPIIVYGQRVQINDMLPSSIAGSIQCEMSKILQI